MNMVAGTTTQVGDYKITTSAGSGAANGLDFQIRAQTYNQHAPAIFNLHAVTAAVLYANGVPIYLIDVDDLGASDYAEVDTQNVATLGCGCQVLIESCGADSIPIHFQEMLEQKQVYVMHQPNCGRSHIHFQQLPHDPIVGPYVDDGCGNLTIAPHIVSPQQPLVIGTGSGTNPFIMCSTDWAQPNGPENK